MELRGSSSETEASMWRRMQVGGVRTAPASGRPSVMRPGPAPSAATPAAPAAPSAGGDVRAAPGTSTINEAISSALHMFPFSLADRRELGVHELDDLPELPVEVLL